MVCDATVKIWHAKDNYYGDDELVEWYNGYKQRKDLGAEIKEELMPIVWHSMSIQDWSMTEGQKKRIKEMLT